MGIVAHIQRAGVLEYLWGDVGSSGPIDRSTLVSGTYNPVYTSGPPSMGGNYLTNTVGIFTAPSNLAETEGANINYATNGQVITDTAFYRRVSCVGQNITFRNCIFYGTPTDYQAPLTCNASNVNSTFEDCTFAPMAPQYRTPCVRIGAGGGTFLRCDFYGGTDGVSNNSTGGWPQQWNFTQCAFHDLLYTSPDPDAAGGIDDNASHTDDIQWGGGRLKLDGCGFWGFFDMGQYQAGKANTAFGSGSTTNTTSVYPYHMFGNKYTDTVARAGDARTPPAVVGQPSIYTTSNVMFSPIYRQIEYFEMTNCYMDGTSWALNIGNPATTFAGAGTFKFTNNKVGTNHRWAQNGTNEAIAISGGLEAGMVAAGTFTGNTDLLTGAALTYADLT